MTTAENLVEYESILGGLVLASMKIHGSITLAADEVEASPLATPVDNHMQFQVQYKNEAQLRAPFSYKKEYGKR